MFTEEGAPPPKIRQIFTAPEAFLKRKALFEVPLKWLALFGEIQKYFCFYNSLYRYVKARRYVKTHENVINKSE